MFPISVNPKNFSTYIFYLVLPVLAVILPLILVLLNLPITPRVSMTSAQLFELFGFCMWVVLAINVYREIKINPGISFKKGIIIVLPVLVSFFFLVLISEYATPSWDYEQYQNAFQAIVRGGNPYGSTRYLYPPPFAQTMASLYLFGHWIFSPETINPWLFVYYIHECLQFFLLNVAYWLSCRFAFRTGFPKLEGVLLVSGLFLFNYPLFRTLNLNQVNLYVLNATLLAVLALRRFPFLSGTAVALGGLIKIYPLTLGVPLLGMKKWKAILGALVSGGIIILIQTNFGRNLALWKQFISFYFSFPVERESSLCCRNDSPLSFIRNFTQLAHAPAKIIPPLFILTAFALLIWMIIRFFQREKRFRSMEPGYIADTYRDFGNFLDFSVLTLLIAPSAWDHHFVLAIPLALWAIALQSQNKLGWIGIGIASIFILPAFNIFPLSYLRLAGLLMLLWFTHPKFPFDPCSIGAAAEAWRAKPVANSGV